MISHKCSVKTLMTTQVVWMLSFTKICNWQLTDRPKSVLCNRIKRECIGVLRHTQRYFSYICDGTGGLKKKWDRRSGSQRHRHFLGFFNVLVQAPTRGHPFYGYSEKPSHLVAFYNTLGIRRAYYHLKPRGTHGEHFKLHLWS